MTEEASGVKISEGDWKSLNNRLEALDKSLKSANTTITDQGKQLTKQSTNVPNIVQVVMKTYNDYDTTSTIIPVDNTIPQSSEGKKFMEIIIKPKDEKNWLIVEAFATFTLSTSGYIGSMALFKDGGVSAICATSALNGQNLIKYKIIAGKTNEVTFQINLGSNNAGIPLYFNGFSAARLFGDIPKSYIQVTEVLASAIS